MYRNADAWKMRFRRFHFHDMDADNPVASWPSLDVATGVLAPSLFASMAYNGKAETALLHPVPAVGRQGHEEAVKTVRHFRWPSAGFALVLCPPQSGGDVHIRGRRRKFTG